MITKIVESRLGDNYDKKLDLFQKIKDLIKEYPDIETHVVEEIFGGKDKFDSYDVSEHKVNEVANLLGRVKRYVEDSVGYDKTQTKNENLEEDLDSEWRELETKQITDSDGFLTDYTLYTNGVTYICMYGDKDVYSPDIDEADYESDSEDEAYEWFNNYNGFDEDDVDEGVNMVNKISESKLTEGYYDISVDNIKDVISRLEDLVDGLESLGMSSITPATNTYGMSNFVGIASKGYIDLDRIDDYLGDSEDEEYEEESLKEELSVVDYEGILNSVTKGVQLDGKLGKTIGTEDLEMKIIPSDESINRVISQSESLGFKEVDRYIDNDSRNDSWIVFAKKTDEGRCVISIIFNSAYDYAWVNAGDSEEYDDYFVDSESLH